jgi:hypothetical protein
MREGELGAIGGSEILSRHGVGSGTSARGEGEVNESKDGSDPDTRWWCSGLFC